MKIGKNNPALVAKVIELVCASFGCDHADIKKSANPAHKNIRAILTGLLKNEYGQKLKVVKAATGITNDPQVYIDCKEAKGLEKTSDIKGKVATIRAEILSSDILDTPEGGGDSQKAVGVRKSTRKKKGESIPETDVNLTVMADENGAFARVAGSLCTADLLTVSDPALALRTRKVALAYIMWDEHGAEPRAIAEKLAVSEVEALSFIGEAVVHLRGGDKQFKALVKSAQ